MTEKILILLEETECHDDEFFWTYALVVDEDFEKDSQLDIPRLGKALADGSIKPDTKYPRPRLPKKDTPSVYHRISLTPPNISSVILWRIPTLQVMIASCFVKKELFPLK